MRRLYASPPPAEAESGGTALDNIKHVVLPLDIHSASFIMCQVREENIPELLEGAVLQSVMFSAHNSCHIPAEIFMDTSVVSSIGGCSLIKIFWKFSAVMAVELPQVFYLKQ